MMCNDKDRSAHGIECETAKTDRHLERMHSHDQFVQSVKSRILLGPYLKDAPYHFYG